MCDDYKHHVSIGFLFNTQGVSPQPPWFWPQKSNLDIYSSIFHSFNISDSFGAAQGPAIAPLLKGYKGPVDAYMVNSVFWDIGRLVTGTLRYKGGLDICNIPYKRAEHVASWARNASDLVLTIDHYFPHAKWKAWRTANHISNAIPSCRNDLVDAMNLASHHIATSNHMHWMDFASFPGVIDDMRDAHHPNANVTASFMQFVIENIQSRLS